MRKPSFNQIFSWWKNNRKYHLAVWITFHVLVFSCFFIRGSFSVNSDLASLLPDTSPVKSVSHVEKIINQRFNSGIYILIGHKDFSTARASAEKLVSHMRAHGGFKSIQLELDTAALGRLRNFLFLHRYQLLTPEIRELLTRERLQELSEKAYMELSSPLSLGGLDHLDLDPFLLVNSSIAYYLNSGVLSNVSLGIRDGVLSTEYDGKSWVLISARTSGSGFAVRVKNSPIAMIYSTTHAIASSQPGLEFVFSGAPFHSYESSRKSQVEISILSSISIIFIILLILFVFRSVKPLLATVGAIIIGIATGLAGTLFIFSEVHIFTIVFGTSLIGISLDYALHFFAQWAVLPTKKTPAAVIHAILPGISLGLLTTLASYLAFVFTAFPLLQQMALFSMIGLASSYLSVIFIFPRFKTAGAKTAARAGRMGSVFLTVFEKLRNLPLAVKIPLAVILLSIIVVEFSQLRLNSDVRALYHMSGELERSERLASSILQHGSAGVYVLVEGNNPENLRIKEERLNSGLSQARDDGALDSFLGSTIFIPSRKRQRENYRLIGRYLKKAVPAQLESLGFGEKEIKNWKEDYRQKKDHWINQAALKNIPLGDLFNILWLGRIQKKYYAVVLLFNIHDIKRVVSIVKESSSAYLINRITDINSTLHNLSVLSLLILCASYLVIFFGLLFRYKIKRTAKIIIIPCLASCLVIGLLHLAGLPFTIFSVMGLILVPGMGTDYVIFFSEGKSHPRSTVLAITMSMLTTIFSFGLLGFTSLAGVFGLTVALGVLFSFLFTPILIGRQPHPHTILPGSR